jgi:hypothetical protein
MALKVEWIALDGYTLSFNIPNDAEHIECVSGSGDNSLYNAGILYARDTTNAPSGYFKVQLINAGDLLPDPETGFYWGLLGSVRIPGVWTPRLVMVQHPMF